MAEEGFAAVRSSDRKAWAMDLVSAAVKKIVGQDLAAEAPLMSAGLDSLGAFPLSVAKLLSTDQESHRLSYSPGTCDVGVK